MPAIPPQLLERLDAAGIREAAIIDEAFEPPQLGALDDLPGFLAEVKAEKEWQRLLTNRNISHDRDSFVKTGILPLWKAHIESPFPEELQEAIEGLFSSYRDQNALLKTVTDHLEQLGMKVHTGGPGTEETLPIDIPLVFLDLNLDPSNAVAPKNAEDFERRAEKMLSVSIANKLRSRSEYAPFLVLFSDRPQAHTYYSHFRKRAEYLGGTFAFLPKMKARDPAHFYGQLASFGIGHPAMRPTLDFYRALQLQVKKASNAVLNDVLELDMQDYSFMQRLALTSDGEPLGTYLLDLFSAVLTYELRCGKEIRDARKALDEIYFERHVASEAQPSLRVQRIYQAAFTDPDVEPVGPHPWAKSVQGSGANVSGLPLLRLGDMFAAKGEKTAFVVINAACDLQFSPPNPGRQGDPETPVTLIHGEMESFKTRLGGQKNKRLDFVEVDDKSWRVLWNHERFHTLTLGEFIPWLRKSGYERVARLNLPYALALQHQWASHQTRIGVTVNPPLPESYSFKLFRPDLAEKRWVKLAGGIGGEVIVARHFQDAGEENRCIFTRSAKEHLVDALTNAHSALLAQVQEFKASSDPAVKRLTSKAQPRINAAEALLRDSDFWTDLTEVWRPLEMNETWKDITTKCLALCWKEPGEEELGKWSQAALALVLRAD